MKILLCIPILNAMKTAPVFLQALSRQTVTKLERLSIDSESSDGSPAFFSAAGFSNQTIERKSFSHGKTRQLGVSLYPDAEIIIFMTQDAILADSCALQCLMDVFLDPQVGAAYGCQLPASNATPIASHARIFNYPAVSHTRTKSDIPACGIKTAFISNSFAAYRRSALDDVGGFPSNVIFGEDTYVAAKMLLNGWKISYCAEAKVYHSHNYALAEEFRRYFDIGVFHTREKWFQESLGKAEGEGRKFVNSEFRYLLKHSPVKIPSSLARTFFKYLGYKLGTMEKRIPDRIKIKLSMNKGFWQQYL